MTRPSGSTAAAAAALVLACALLARARGAEGDESVGFPSPGVPDEAALRALLSSSRGTRRLVVTIGPGTHELSGPLPIRRSDVVLRGAAASSEHATLECASGDVLDVRGAERVELRDLRLRSSAPDGAAIHLVGVPTPLSRSYVADVSVVRCDLEAGTGVLATTGVSGVALVDCTVTVTRSGGSGVVWHDGADLVVHGSRIRSAPQVQARSAVAVGGPRDNATDGRRARGVFVVRNRVRGDFAAGIVVADATDVRVTANDVAFPAPLRAAGAGRVGIVVERSAATAPTADFELVRNVVRRAHTGIHLRDVGSGAVLRNRLDRCASPGADTETGDTGCAVRIAAEGVRCASDLTIARNDFRGLRSPSGTPSVAVTPESAARTCFLDNDRNRVDPDHPLYEGAE